MAQIAWNVRGSNGFLFAIGLFHGDETGHVMLYCNNQVVQVDFSVQQSKSYKLLLNEELCAVYIDKAPDGSYSYRCELDLEADTARNKSQKEKTETVNKQDYLWRFIVAFFLTLLLCLLLFLWWRW